MEEAGVDREKMTVLIRPRRQWEAIDLGVAVGREWFLPLWLLWITGALPALLLSVGAGLLLPGISSVWCLLSFWLFKPLYEPALLLWASRIVFGERLTVKDALGALSKDVSIVRIATLWLLRLNPLRSFVSPVYLLEHLTGKERGRRTVLLNQGYESALYLTAGCCVIELIITGSLVSSLYWLIPENLRWIDFGSFVFWAEHWFLVLLYVVACSLVAPFYVCCGFMLYLTRRVDLEAWDLEIGFRQINRTLRKKRTSGKSLLVLFLLGSVVTWSVIHPPASKADELQPEATKSAIERVLQNKEFGEKKSVVRWVPKEKKERTEVHWFEGLQPFFETLTAVLKLIADHLGPIARFLVLVAFGVFVAAFLLRFSRIRDWIGKYLPKTGNVMRPPAKLFGMDIRPESLPDDLAVEFRALVEAGKKREALSLLYRGVLSLLVNVYRMRIGKSRTENECCVIVSRYRPQEESVFFQQLTAEWLQVAYGHKDPEKGVCFDLLGRWLRCYGERL